MNTEPPDFYKFLFVLKLLFILWTLLVLVLGILIGRQLH